LCRARFQSRVTLDADHLRRARRERQGEIPDAAEEVEYPLRGLELQQVRRARHHRLVQWAVHLDEVRGCEFEA